MPGVEVGGGEGGGGGIIGVGGPSHSPALVMAKSLINP